MITHKNKEKTFVAIVLTLILAVTTITANSVFAHDPPWNIKTYPYVSVTPNPTGVNQEVLVYMWISECPPTAAGPLGDRWHTLGVVITKPDGTIETKGPFDSDPVGGAVTMYTPNQVGTYTFQTTFGGETLLGENLATAETTTPNAGEVYIGDYYEPSKSDIATVIVQEDPILPYQDTPLPTGFWTRPINAQHRGWWSISGNVLEPLLPENRVQQYSLGPESAHILWTEPLVIGGLVGGEFGSYAYHGGSAYQAYFTPPVIISGVLYINKFPMDIKNVGEFRAEGPKPGVLAIDMRTGEEIWYAPDMPRINFGQTYFYESMNQHGTFAYLWSVTGSTWTSFEVDSMDKVVTIENVPVGTQIYGPKGEILRYTLNTGKGYLTLWNNTALTELEAGLDYFAGMWRPHGKTIDAITGYEWNVTLPDGITGKIEQVLDDRIIGSSGLGRPGWTGDIEEYTVWALSLEPGREGQLLWKKDYTAPYDNVVMTMIQCPASVEEGIFTVFCAETREWFAYDIDNGNPVWGPTPSQGVWDIFYETSGTIAYGKMYSTGVSGIIYCYDAQTGVLEWENGVHDATWEAMHGSNYPLRINVIADGKVYASSSEHSPNDPKPRGSPLVCFDAYTGEELWQISMFQNRWGGDPALADGILVTVNAYDNQLVAYGKGPSATTVTAPDLGVPLGSSVVIKGTVTDQSAGAKDTPAIADDSMTDWMKYLYMQFPIPGDAVGVNVTLDTIDPNGNWVHIGTATSNMDGKFGLQWTPDIEGQYEIIATFEGSNAYYSSYATTYLGVDKLPEPTPPEPTPAPMTDTYLTGSTIAILAGIAIAVFLLLRKK